MAVTQEMIDGLTQAIADGVRQVSVPGLTTTYQTTASMMDALAFLKNQFAAEQAAALTTPPVKATYYYHAGRGYNNGGC